MFALMYMHCVLHVRTNDVHVYTWDVHLFTLSITMTLYVYFMSLFEVWTLNLKLGNTHVPVFYCVQVQQELCWREPSLLCSGHFGNKPALPPVPDAPAVAAPLPDAEAPPPQVKDIPVPAQSSQSEVCFTLAMAHIQLLNFSPCLPPAGRQHLS